MDHRGCTVDLGTRTELVLNGVLLRGAILRGRCRRRTWRSCRSTSFEASRCSSRQPRPAANHVHGSRGRSFSPGESSAEPREYLPRPPGRRPPRWWPNLTPPSTSCGLRPPQRSGSFATLGDDVLVIGRFHARGRESGGRDTIPQSPGYTPSDGGRIVRARGLTSTHKEALEAAGCRSRRCRRRMSRSSASDTSG